MSKHVGPVEFANEWGNGFVIDGTLVDKEYAYGGLCDAIQMRGEKIGPVPTTFEHGWTRKEAEAYRDVLTELLSGDQSCTTASSP